MTKILCSKRMRNMVAMLAFLSTQLRRRSDSWSMIDQVLFDAKQWILKRKHWRFIEFYHYFRCGMFAMRKTFPTENYVHHFVSEMHEISLKYRFSLRMKSWWIANCTKLELIKMFPASVDCSKTMSCPNFLNSIQKGRKETRSN